MSGLLDQNMFAQMSAWDKAKALASGYGLGIYNKFKNPEQVAIHGEYPDRLSAQLQYSNPELGFSRENRTPLDAAINYGGGYQWAANPNVNYQDADKMSKAYQLMDYLKSGLIGDTQGKQDAYRDYVENMAGVKQAIADKQMKKKIDDDYIRRLSAQYGMKTGTKESKY